MKYTDPKKIEEVKEFIGFINEKGALASKNVTLAPNDKIYVYKSCKFKRTPLNKLIKEGKIVGVKREYDIDKATIIVLPDVLYNTYFTASMMYTVIRKDKEEQQIGVRSFPSYLWWHHQKEVRKKYGITSSWAIPDSCAEDFAHLIKEVSLQVTSNYAGIEAEHVDLMLNPGIKVIHEDSIQQIVYNINNPTKEVLAEYSIDAIKDLLLSSDTSNHIIATEIIKTTNIEEDYYEFLSLYHSGKMPSEAKQRLYTNVIKLNPKLKRLLPEWKWNSINNIHDLKNLIANLHKLKATLDPVQVYNDYFMNHGRDISTNFSLLRTIYNIQDFIMICDVLGLKVDPLVFMDKVFNLKRQISDQNEKESLQKKTTDREDDASTSP